MDNFKENIAANLEFIVDKTVNPTRTAEEEMVCVYQQMFGLDSNMVCFFSSF